SANLNIHFAVCYGLPDLIKWSSCGKFPVCRSNRYLTRERQSCRSSHHILFSYTNGKKSVRVGIPELICSNRTRYVAAKYHYIRIFSAYVLQRVSKTFTGLLHFRSFCIILHYLSLICKI